MKVERNRAEERGRDLVLMKIEEEEEEEAITLIVDIIMTRDHETQIAGHQVEREAATRETTIGAIETRPMIQKVVAETGQGRLIGTEK